MTLIVAAANCNATVVVADRRLTKSGSLVTDEAGKLAIVLTEDSRFAFAFAGLASIGVSSANHHQPTTDISQFRTAQWMLEAMSKAATPEPRLEPMIERFRDAATRQWRMFPTLSPEQKFTEFVVAGHVQTETQRIHSFGRVITNAPDGTSKASGEFVINEDNAGRYYVLLAGFDEAARAEDVDGLGKAITDARDQNTLLQKARLVARRAADHTNALIGKQQTSLTIPRNWAIESFGEYHTDIPVTTAYNTSIVDVRHGGAIVLLEPELRIQNLAGDPDFAALPDVGRRKPCPCGSGKRYKNCHGRGTRPSS